MSAITAQPVGVAAVASAAARPLQRARLATAPRLARRGPSWAARPLVATRAQVEQGKTSPASKKDNVDSAVETMMSQMDGDGQVIPIEAAVPDVGSMPETKEAEPSPAGKGKRQRQRGFGAPAASAEGLGKTKKVGGFGGGGGKGMGAKGGTGKKGAKGKGKKGDAPSLAPDNIIIRKTVKSFTEMEAEFMSKHEYSPPKYMISVRQAPGDAPRVAMLSDWLPVGEACVCDDPDSELRDTFRDLHANLPALLPAVGCLMAQVEGRPVKGLGLQDLEVAVESLDSFLDAIEAVTAGEEARKAALAALGVGNNASRAEIRDVYRKIAATQHPDQLKSEGAEREKDEEAFKTIVSSYELLMERSHRSAGYEKIGGAERDLRGPIDLSAAPRGNWESKVGVIDINSRYTQLFKMRNVIRARSLASANALDTLDEDEEAAAVGVGGGAGGGAEAAGVLDARAEESKAKAEAEKAEAEAANDEYMEQFRLMAEAKAAEAKAAASQ